MPSDPTVLIDEALRRKPPGHRAGEAVLAAFRVSGYTLVSDAELERLRRIEAAATYAFRAMRQQGWHENGAPVMGTAEAKLRAALASESSNAK